MNVRLWATPCAQQWQVHCPLCHLLLLRLVLRVHEVTSVKCFPLSAEISQSMIELACAFWDVVSLSSVCACSNITWNWCPVNLSLLSCTRFRGQGCLNGHVFSNCLATCPALLVSMRAISTMFIIGSTQVSALNSTSIPFTSTFQVQSNQCGLFPWSHHCFSWGKFTTVHAWQLFQ